MTAQQLRNSILQQAIQGRLVPQDPSEGSADVLLSAIRQKKELLYKSKKISKRDFEVSEIQEDEIPFDIPESWAWIRIGEIFKHSTGKSLNEANRKGNPHEYITTSNVFWNRFELKKLRQMYYTDEELDKCQAEPGDLLVLEGGDVGRAAVWNKDYKICLQNHIHKLHPYEPLDVYFYYYCFFLYHDMGLIGGKGIGIQGLSSGALHNIVFPLPPLAEQRRIVAKIEELMPLVEKYGKAQTELDTLNQDLPRRLRQSVLQQAIQGKLVEQDEKEGNASELLLRLREVRRNKIKSGEIKLSKPEKALKIEISNDFDLPSSWTWCVLNDVCRAFGRIGFRGYTKEDIVSSKEEGAIAISPSNMENLRLNFNKCTYITEAKYQESPEIMVENGDVLLTKTASVGKLALVENLPWKATINPQIAVLKEISIDNKYLTYVLASPYIQDIIHGFTIGTSIPTYSQEKMLGINIPLPPLAEQRRIVAKIEELFAEIDKLK